MRLPTARTDDILTLHHGRLYHERRGEKLGENTFMLRPNFFLKPAADVACKDNTWFGRAREVGSQELGMALAMGFHCRALAMRNVASVAILCCPFYCSTSLQA